MRMDDYNSFQIILKVNSSNNHLRCYEDKTNSIFINQTHSYRIYCHDLENHAGLSSSRMKVFVMSESSLNTSCKDQYAKTISFANQKSSGEPIGLKDYTLFMSPVYEAGRRASFAIDLGIIKHSTSLENLCEEECQKLGTAYMYLDPRFATQGVQRMQIIGAKNFSPIGHLQVEYLIIKNPIANEMPMAKPKWLSGNPFIHQGHRGAGPGCRGDLVGRSSSLTENTIESFNYAAKHGADMCELDVMCTLDGVPVVYHDFKLEVKDLGVKQIDQLTFEEIRNLKLASIHDKNCNHYPFQQKEFTLSIPTLEEVLAGVDLHCALNIELKFPQLCASGKNEAQRYREINDYVDRILACIDEYGNNRSICVSTMNPDVAILLRLKQVRYPVLFITTCDPNRFMDPVTKSVQAAIYFAKAFDMAGVNPNVSNLSEKLVRFAQDRGLLVYAWGKIETAQAVKDYKRFGLNGLIYDKIDLIKPLD